MTPKTLRLKPLESLGATAAAGVIGVGVEIATDDFPCDPACLVEQVQQDLPPPLSP